MLKLIIHILTPIQQPRLRKKHSLKKLSIDTLDCDGNSVIFLLLHWIDVIVVFAGLIFKYFFNEIWAYRLCDPSNSELKAGQSLM